MLFLSSCYSICNPFGEAVPEQQLLFFCFCDTHIIIFLLLHKGFLQIIKQDMGGSFWLVLICYIAHNLIVIGTTAVHNFMFVQQYVIEIDVVC